MTKQGKFTKSYAHELLRIAKQDLDSAQFLSQQKGLRVENVFLLAQQALEKGLKAVLCWHEAPVPFVHEIGVLVAKIEALNIVVPFGFDLNSLSEFATVRRYFEGKEDWVPEDVIQILTHVDKAIQWCQSQVT